MASVTHRFWYWHRFRLGQCILQRSTFILPKMFVLIAALSLTPLLHAETVEPRSAQEILTNLSESQQSDTFQIPFREVRRYQLRKTDMIFHGTLRLLENRAISIEYNDPVHRLFILDNQGLRIREPESGQETVAPEEAGAMVSLFLDLLALNLTRLENQFSMSVLEDEPEGWKVELIPETRELHRFVLAIDLEGQGTELKSIFLQHGHSRWKRIEFDTLPQPWTPDSDSLQKYF